MDFTLGDVSVVRATSLSNYPRLVVELGGDPVGLLTEVGIDPDVVGHADVFVPLGRVAAAIENAASTTGTRDLGRQLARLQGIEILGPVGVAARTSSTVAEALRIFENFLTAYSPGLGLQVSTESDPRRSFVEYEVLDLVARWAGDTDGRAVAATQIEWPSRFDARGIQEDLGAHFAVLDDKVRAIAETGSSARISSGAWYSTRAMPTRCNWPPESWSQRW